MHQQFQFCGLRKFQFPGFHADVLLLQRFEEDNTDAVEFCSHWQEYVIVIDKQVLRSTAYLELSPLDETVMISLCVFNTPFVFNTSFVCSILSVLKLDIHFLFSSDPK